MLQMTSNHEQVITLRVGNVIKSVENRIRNRWVDFEVLIIAPDNHALSLFVTGMNSSLSINNQHCEFHNLVSVETDKQELIEICDHF